MDNRLSLILIALLLGFAVSSCDGGGDGGCTEITTENNFMLIFQGCPNDGIKAVCNSFICTLTDPELEVPLPVPVVINPDDCSRIDRCVNLICNLGEENMVSGQIILSTLEILPGNSFVGAADLNDQGPYDFVCDIVLP